MSRLAFAYLGLIFVLCALIVFNPLGWLWSGADDAVNRAEGPVAGYAAAPALAPAGPAAAGSAAGPAAGSAAGSTAAALSAAVALGLAPAPAAPAPPVTGLRVEDAGLAATTEAVLAGLAGALPAKVPAKDEALAGMSLKALADLRAARAGAGPGGVLTLPGLVAQALREGQSDAYIDALVNEAAGRGAVSVPAMLVTSDGRVDTAVLLADIVARAAGVELAEGDLGTVADSAAPAAPVAGGTAGGGANVTYTVEVGDSLGSLALRFYGDSGLYPLIFEANRGLMASPDRIRVGQVLIIPGRG